MVFESEFINAGLEKKVIRIHFATSINDLRKFNPKKVLIALELFIRLVYTLITFKPDVVYFSFMPIGYGFWRDFLYLMIIKLFGARPILHLDNQGIAAKSNNRFYRSVYNLTFRNCSVIHVNQYLLEKELNHLNLKGTSLYYVHNTIEPFETERIATSDHKKKQILFLSNLFPIKGANILIKGFSQFANSYPDYHLIISGEFPSKKVEFKLKSLVDSLQLKERITFTGGVYGSDKIKLFSESSLFVLPSLTDCFPLVILEAMHFGIPVITSKVGGLHTIFQEFEEILFIDPINPEEVSKKACQLLANHELREIIGVNGRERSIAITKTFESDMKGVIHSTLNS